MSSLIELETFISINEQAERMAKDSFSDKKSESYKTAFVAHFKSLLRAKTYDFASEFLSEMEQDLNSTKKERPECIDGPFFEFGYIKQFLKHFPSELKNALSLSKSCHGGARQNAGRKKAAPTKQIRIDAELAEQFKMLSELYRGQSDTDKQKILLELVKVGSSYCDEKCK